ncbi:MAG: hypothetical protein K0R98_1874 [Rickettsiaceae bacterium]|jgi:hypothetical protein|nr:hypothetical protein [Rickettsiaceae bacterium]
MVTEIDERRGLVKVSWKDIRDRVAKVEPTFVKIVDELSPDKNFPLFLAYFPYGALKGDTHSPFIPKEDGGFYRLSDPNAPKDVIKHLGYGKADSPLGMVLEKNFELFVDLKNEGITIPRAIYAPGHFFSFIRNLSKQNSPTHSYSTNRVLSTSSGARSTLMLPSIGCMKNHVNLQREFNIQLPAPKALYDHWAIFKEIAGSPILKCDWRSCLLYFSEPWIKKLHSDKSWAPLKLYLHEKAWQFFKYDLNRHQFELAFSLIQKKRNLKPNPYLADTAKHLFGIAVAGSPGYAPSCNNAFLPLADLQQVFVESYRQKKYIPTVIQPAYFNFEQDNLPIYYSLLYPSTFEFSPKARKIPNTLFDLRELKHILKTFQEELSGEDNVFTDSVMHRAAKSIIFRYFHNEYDRHHVIQDTSEITDYDKRFNFIMPGVQENPGAHFASDAAFVRGCISIQTRKKFSVTRA